MAHASETAVKEPLVRIVKLGRGEVAGKRKFIVSLASFVAAILICFIYVVAVGKGAVNPADAVKQMFEGTFGVIGNKTSMSIKIWDTIMYATKLLCVAVALTPAFKMKFWNIGAEGQIICGGLVAGIFMHDFPQLFSSPIGIILSIVLGVVAGGIWGLIPAFFKAQWGTNETLFTLMMNYIAMKIMDSFYNVWKGQNSSLSTFDESTWLPKVLNHTYTINIIVFLALAVLMYFYLSKTKHGYEISVVGESVNTARYAGINVKKVILRTMGISGSLCGLCGALTVLGQTHTIAFSGEAVHTTTNGYGFTAIIVSWLAGFNTLGMILFSLLILFLSKGTEQLGNKYSAFATGAGNVMIGIVLFCVIGGAFFNRYKFVFRSKGGKE